MARGVPPFCSSAAVGFLVGIFVGSQLVTWMTTWHSWWFHGKKHRGVVFLAMVLARSSPALAGIVANLPMVLGSPDFLTGFWMILVCPRVVGCPKVRYGHYHPMDGTRGGQEVTQKILQQEPEPRDSKGPTTPRLLQEVAIGSMGPMAIGLLSPAAYSMHLGRQFRQCQDGWFGKQDASFWCTEDTKKGAHRMDLSLLRNTLFLENVNCKTKLHKNIMS